MDKRRWIFLKDGNRSPQKSDSIERESSPESGSALRDKPIYIYIRDPMILGNGDVAATYISVNEAAKMVADLQAEIRRYTRCNCHQGKKCAYCLMKDGEL